ncbi:hypothetical protein, partial [Senegalia massiliensis]
NSKNVIDLSPKIFRIVSIISIITILTHIIIDIIYVGNIKHDDIVPSVLLIIFCEFCRGKSLAEKNS